LCVLGELMTLAGLPQGDLRKLQYALDMCAVPHPFDEAVPLEPVVVEVRQLSTLSAVCGPVFACAEAIEWQAARTPEEVMQQREEMIGQLEDADKMLRRSGKCAHWFSKCDDATKRVSSGVNGYLLQELLRASSHRDLAAADLFKNGIGMRCVKQVQE
jgi:hypothetical protein